MQGELKVKSRLKLREWFTQRIDSLIFDISPSGKVARPSEPFGQKVEPFLKAPISFNADCAVLGHNHVVSGKRPSIVFGLQHELHIAAHSFVNKLSEHLRNKTNYILSNELSNERAPQNPTYSVYRDYRQ